MADGILYGIVVQILKKVGSSVLDQIALAWGFKSDLEKLEITISTIRDVLLDAEEKQADGNAVRGWLNRLGDAVYAADDLFDEVTTVAARKQLMGTNKLTKEVRTFFTSNNQTKFARSISQKIKTIREELDVIVKLGSAFGLASRAYEEGRVVTRRRDQSFSFVDSEEIIGRDADKKAVLNLLCDSSSGDDGGHDYNKALPVISIVGIGGLGKTALAQLVYNDPLVDDLFELKLWVGVSNSFDIKELAKKILMSGTGTSSEVQDLEMDKLQRKLRKEIGDKKFLLVLDDVWNENREEWLKMRALLKWGKKGSKILVTTRSGRVAKVMCTIPPYELQGLSEEKSWDLFEKLAFMPDQVQQMPHLVRIGKEIVQKCANVPLAIRTLGRTLYGEDESKWLSIKDKSLAKISDKESDIMDILKISYHHLRSELKNCFAYCALFPKDSDFNKEMLIDLWMAEGFIVSVADESQNLKELGEECFHTLLQRGFFQEVELDECGFIDSCKMHDLMHDLAQEVAGVKCKVVKPNEVHNQSNVRHLSIDYRLNFQRTIPAAILKLKLPRTLLLPQQIFDGSTLSKSICEQIISSFRCLRVLDLHDLGLTNLPTSIGKLIHLRFLCLSMNPFKALPDSITELHNLQTLLLDQCEELRQLPKNISKLIKLRTLDIRGCSYLRNIPSGIGELTSLHHLPLFFITRTAQLHDLKNLNNLRGDLCIKIGKNLKNRVLEPRDEYLTCKQGLTKLTISFKKQDENLNEVLLESLKPHPNLRSLEISFYKGHKLPSWTMMDSLLLSLPKLVEIHLISWKFCQQVPSFSQLPLLKVMKLSELENVEYIEMDNNFDVLSSSKDSPLIFRSLEKLELSNMNKLKGWWKEVGSPSESGLAPPIFPSSFSFPKLLQLKIHNCPIMTSLPSCPDVEEVKLVDFNKKLSVLKMLETSPKLKKLKIDNTEHLLSMPKQCLHQLSSLHICDCELVNTNVLGELFATLSSSLRSLKFTLCRSLRYISEGLEHLTALEELTIADCTELDLSLNELQQKDEDGGNGMPWKAFKTSLCFLRLRHIPKLVSLPSELQCLANLRDLVIIGTGLRELPEWISCFSSLEYLEISDCEKLKSLPEGFRKLTALQVLYVNWCPKLTKRCTGPNGKDWPKIQHVPLPIIEKPPNVFTRFRQKLCAA